MLKEMFWYWAWKRVAFGGSTLRCLQYIPGAVTWERDDDPQREVRSHGMFIGVAFGMFYFFSLWFGSRTCSLLCFSPFIRCSPCPSPTQSLLMRESRTRCECGERL